MLQNALKNIRRTKISQACRPTLEAALKRPLSDQEYNQIVADFTQAQKDAAKAFGKGFNSLPKADKAKAIASQLNVNRAKSLTNLEAQLLSNAKVADVSGTIKSTLGQDITLIDGKELASNINNMLGSTTTRTGFLNRGGSRITLDVALNTLRNDIARVLYYDSPVIVKGFDEVVDISGSVKNIEAENKLMDQILNDPSVLQPLLNHINSKNAEYGITTPVTKLDLSVSRDDIAYLWLNSNKNIDQAAATFKSTIDPLLASGNKVDIEQLYKDLLSNVDQLDTTIAKSPVALLNDLKFKDGAAYMDFLRMFGRDKNIVLHVASTLNNTSLAIAKKAVFGDENVVATIDQKIANTPNIDSTTIKRLEASKRAYQELTGDTGRTYTKNIYDLGLAVTKNWTTALFLGTSAIKGAATDTINAVATYGARGEIGLAIRSQVEQFTQLGKGDRNTFIVGMDELVNSTQHYANTAGEGVLSKNPVVSGLQRVGRFTQNLAGKVQAVQGQNIVIRAKKRSLGVMAEHELFQPTLRVELTDSINPLTHALGQKLGFKNLKDVYSLDKNAYNAKLGKNVDDVEFSNIKRDLTLEFEGAVMHQVQSVQIDSGGVSVQSQNARIFGNLNSNARRFGLPVFGQFMAYSQNYILKNSLIRGILTDPSLVGKIKYGLIAATVVVMSGYSNYNVGQVVREGSKDGEYADPITDIQLALDGDEDAQERFTKAVMSGMSLPGLKQGSTIFIEEGKASALAPTLSYVAGVLTELWDVIASGGEPQDVSQLIQKLAGFTTPGLYDLIYRIRQEIYPTE